MSFPVGFETAQNVHNRTRHLKAPGPHFFSNF